MAEAFVIHLHTGGGGDHYDLMLQRAPGEALATWRVAGDPSELAVGDDLPAARLADHREAYLTYEGRVSGGRGRVRRIDRGPCRVVRAVPARWEFRLAGEKCIGPFALVQCGEDPERWTLRRLPEEGQGGGA